jgi:hypothetical protein
MERDGFVFADLLPTETLRTVGGSMETPLDPRVRRSRP